MRICNKCGNEKTGDYCKHCQKKYSKKWRNNNKDKVRTIVKSWRSKNSDKFKKNANAYYTAKRKEDPLYKATHNLRVRLRKVFKGTKSRRTQELLGCTFEEAFLNISGKFQPGMTWENYGKWHIDHKYPLSLAKNVEELEKLCHIDNLQPLWAIDNIKKGNRLNLNED